MRVAVDARHLGAARGIPRYTATLLRALAERHAGDAWVALLPGSAAAPQIPGVEVVRTPVPSRVVHGAAALTGRPRADELAGGADVLWVPAPAPVAWSPGVPMVLTVHDRSFEARPGDFTRYERAWHRLARPRELAARAAAVVTVSQAVRDELLAAGWPLDPARTHVVRSGPGTIPIAVGANGHREIAEPYLLWVGALEPRKGLDVLLEAFASADPPARLVVVGEGRLAPLLTGRPGVIALGGVDEVRLDSLLRHAIALVHPSHLEGFAFPPLEAAVRGVPAIVADLPVYAETLGDGVLRVPAGDPAALAAALTGITADPAARERLGGAAAAAAATLSWERAADELRAVLARAADAGPGPA